MLLTMLYFPLLGALMPLTSIAFPTNSDAVGTSKTPLDQLFGRNQAPHEQVAKRIIQVKPARTAMIPTSIDPTDDTPIYTFTNSSMPPPNNIFTNVSAPVVNDPGSAVVNFKWGIGPVVVRRETPISNLPLVPELTDHLPGIDRGQNRHRYTRHRHNCVDLRYKIGRVPR